MGDDLNKTLSDMAVDIAKIQANTENMKEDIKGHGTTLYGREGRTGLVQEIENLKASQKWWNRGLAIFPVLLIGLKGLIGWPGK